MISIEKQISDIAERLKDAGASVEDYGVSKYAPVIDALLKNPTLILPQ